MNCQGYINLIAQGKYEDAKNEIRAYLPFASILGRVCNAPCEDICERNKIDGALQIRALKRYLADCCVNESDMFHAVGPETGNQVAVIGSGPAGLMAAWQIKKSGHQVTVYDSEEKPGGLMRYGIPESRLPKKKLDTLIHSMEACMTNFEMATKIGIDIPFEQLIEQNDAVIISVGSGQSASLDMPGKEHCLHGLTVLGQSNSGENILAGNHIAVIGGGNTAINVALMYKRMGAKDVDVMVRRTLKDLRAYQSTISEAIEEGVSFMENSVPASVTQLDNGRYELKLNRSILQFNSSNELFYTVNQNQCQTIVVDQVVMAVGQSMGTHTLPEKFLAVSLKLWK